MTRILSLLLLMALLYGSAPAFSSETGAAAPDIALILPLKAPEFELASDAVRRGFMAAATLSPDIRVKLYPLQNEGREIVAAYREATGDGARVVVGPLTRDGVSALAAFPGLKAPALALNVADGKAPPANLYLFGLQIESGARQAARIAYAEGRRRAFVFSGDSLISKRVRQSFADEWQKLGGELLDLPITATDVDTLQALQSSAAPASDAMAFLALDGPKARLVRPFLDPALAVYATFLVYEGAENALANIDIDGVRFPELPWLVEPDHPAVMAYPPSKEKSAELDRWYALGIDAFRLARQLGSSPLPKSLDGVTGSISLEGKLFATTLTPAVMLQGQVHAVKALK